LMILMVMVIHKGGNILLLLDKRFNKGAIKCIKKYYL
jgi:hypothetical protein